MVRFLALLFLLNLSAPPTFAQDCPPPVGVVTRDTQLSQHMSLYPLCTRITGDLQLGHQDCSVPCTLTDLSPLRGVVSITGTLSIQCCNSLTDISGFPSLTTIIGSIVVYYNRDLTDISGFTALQTIEGSIVISQNHKLLRITGFSNLNLVNDHVSIERNSLLNNLNGFKQLRTINGDKTSSGNTLVITYNIGLTSLSGLSGLTNISYGTVRVEGNTALCYAGYPLWEVGAYPLRPSSSDQGADKGIDWRTKLSGVESWQFTWGVMGGGYPTLIVRDNAPLGSCAAASCDVTCLSNAGCLGPNDPAFCGSCDLVGTFDPCEGLPPRSNTAAIVGVVVALLGVVLLVLLGLGIWGCVVCGRKWKESRKGSFDINLEGLDNTDYVIENTSSRRGYSSNPASSDLIASYSTNTGGEPTVTTTYTSPAHDSHAHSSSISKNRDSPIRLNKNPAPRGSGVGVARNTASDDPSVKEYKSPGSPARKGGVALGVDTGRSPKSYRNGSAKGLRNQSSSRENLLSSSRDNITEDHTHPSQDSGGSTGANEQELSRNTVEETAKNRTSLISREPSVEDILKKLLEEKAEIPMNFPRQQVKIVKEMGNGDFGKVLQAEAKKLLPGQKKTMVVIKQLKDGATPEERQAFLRPVEAMKILRHPNVLSLMGVVSQGPALQVMLEYCAQGNFKTFLVTKRREGPTLKKNGLLLKMAIDMATGLCYLHSMSVAHNDFAVRSCLVTGDGRVKLGDYGITRQTYKEDYYARGHTQKAWPIRWMAPEQVIIEGKNSLDSLPVSMPANIW